MDFRSLFPREGRGENIGDGKGGEETDGMGRKIRGSRGLLLRDGMGRGGKGEMREGKGHRKGGEEKGRAGARHIPIEIVSASLLLCKLFRCFRVYFCVSLFRQTKLTTSPDKWGACVLHFRFHFNPTNLRLGLEGPRTAEALGGLACVRARVCNGNNVQ